MAAAQHRRLLLGFFALFLLQGLFVIFSSRSPSLSVVCLGQNCQPHVELPINPSNHTNSSRLGTPPPPPPPPPHPAVLTSTGTPPNWTLAEPPDTWPELLNTLFDYIEKPHARCEKAVRIGGQPDYTNRKFDGYKWVCLDPALGLLQTNSCLIYSFGVDHDWSFDDNVQRLQCEIHAFDPSIGQKDHRRSARIFFHNVGVGGKNEIKTTRLSLLSWRRWDVRTYENIVSFLGHRNRTVHYLKVDVEGSEWAMFTHIFTHSPHLLLNVRQVAIEVHMQSGQHSKSPNLEAWRGYLEIFLRLERMGFRLFRSEVNPYTKLERIFPQIERRVARVYEMVWIYQPW